MYPHRIDHSTRDVPRLAEVWFGNTVEADGRGRRCVANLACLDGRLNSCWAVCVSDGMDEVEV